MLLSEPTQRLAQVPHDVDHWLIPVVALACLPIVAERTADRAGRQRYGGPG
jgi:hypothetical protein